MSNKALPLSNTELELTQRIQMHFPRGAISAKALQYWNGCTQEEWEKKIIPKLVEMLSCAPKEGQGPILRRLYFDDVVTVDSVNMEVYELMKSANVLMMYDFLGGNLKKLCMTVAQREAFCVKHIHKLKSFGLTLFLHKTNEQKPADQDNLHVACVYKSGAYLSVNFGLFAPYDVYPANYQSRIVVPAIK